MVSTLRARTVCVSVEQELYVTSSMMHGAGAALGAVAAELGAGEPQLVAQRHRQRFLRQHVHAPHLAIHVEGNQPLDAAGGSGPCALQPAGRRTCRSRRIPTAPEAMTRLMNSRRE